MRTPIEVARQIGNAVGAQRVVVITFDGSHCGITTWGDTTRHCNELAQWAESEAATKMACAIAGARVESSCISVACVPGASDDRPDEHPHPASSARAGETAAGGVMTSPDILEALAVLWRCRRCSCRSCVREGCGELHDHICTNGPHCVETREKWRKYRRFAAVTAKHAAVEIEALRRQLVSRG